MESLTLAMYLVDINTPTSLTSYPASSTSRSSSTSRPSSAPTSTTTPDDDTSTPPLPGAPISPLFEIRQTPTAGRAVFATRAAPAGTLLWRADDLVVCVLLREYRREVCAQCFAYDDGRDLRIRDQTVGFAFCSEPCRTLWKQQTGEVGVQAWTEVERLVKKRSKEDNELVDVDAPRPGAEEIARAWEGVAEQAEQIRAARVADEAAAVTKRHRKAVQKAVQQPIQADVMSFCAGGVVARYTDPSRWESVLSLAVHETPYRSADDLRAFTRTYLHLLAILPLPLLAVTTPETLFLLSSRDNHNSFGIRSLEDEGSEFFGYGCWPSASYFNHSCAPNVEKRREGRAWEFRAGKDIVEGEELNITYLGGEEKEWSREKRVATLKKNWGFECGCQRCGI